MFLIKQVLVLFYLSIFSVNSLDIYRKLEKILHDCFQDNLNPLIVTEEFEQFFNENNPTPLIIIDQNFKPNNNYIHHPKLATFVLAADSVFQVEQTLSLINSSAWWNIDSYFFLVQIELCNNTSTILHSAWEKKLLSVILMCPDTSQGVIMLYTFNPFTNLAPNPWALTASDQKFGDTWNLYHQLYSGGAISCENLMYDKLKYLNGYQLNAFAFLRPGVSQKLSEKRNIAFMKEAAEINLAEFYQNLFSIWNATVYIDYDIHKGLINLNKYDMMLTQLAVMAFNATSLTYPLRQSSLMILSQKQPFLSPSEKITSFYSPGVWLMISVSFLSMVIVLMINRHQRVSSATLEVIRLMAGHGIEQPLYNQPIRLYFFGILCFFVILNGIFCSKLVEFLTKPDRKNIDSLSDLQNVRTIYIHPFLYNIGKQELSSFNKSIRLTNEINNITSLLNHSRAAFITISQRGYDEALHLKLHLSKPFLNYYVSTIVNKSFPFKQRINEIAFRWFESGLQKYWDDQTLYKLGRKLSISESAVTELKIRPISLVDFAFAFKLLAIGLGCSFVVFIFEVSRRSN